MGAHRVYRQRNYAFGQQLLTLRTRAHLTQIALAGEIGVNRRSVLKRETGESYPKAETLQRLIAIFLIHHAFTERGRSARKPKRSGARPRRMRLTPSPDSMMSGLPTHL